MFRSQTRPPSAIRHVPIRFRDSIEWEEVEVPGRAVKATPAANKPAVPEAALGAITDFSMAWSNTLPAHLADSVPPPVSTFTEPLQGLAMREMNEPDVFQHFFG